MSYILRFIIVILSPMSAGNAKAWGIFSITNEQSTFLQTALEFLSYPLLILLQRGEHQCAHYGAYDEGYDVEEGLAYGGEYEHAAVRCHQCAAEGH